MKKTLLLLIFSYFTFSITAQNNFPKRELRAAWIPSVYNLDWPTSKTASSENQKNELINILEELKKSGINTVFLQIRTECDALYQSDLEPWSYWLTGQQGKAPEPFYDPLKFACEEAKKRNLELHAWINPYRAQASVGDYSIDQNHITVKHPEWILKIGKYKFLNPGLNETRIYVKNIVADIVSRYDVAGIHFDDYFYPYSPNSISDEDKETFANNPRGFLSIEDWRRDNVNILVKSVYDTIKAIKPYVKFGISPFGIWKNNVPSGIVGTSSYNDLYCDPLAWLRDQYIDYVNPQLYWEIGGAQDYSKLMQWWSFAANQRHIYIGHALYKMTNSHNWNVNEIINQIELNRKNKNIFGSAFYRASSIINNSKKIKDSLSTRLFKYYSLIPEMTWKDSIPPNGPEDLSVSTIDFNTPNTKIELHWRLPDIAPDGEIANKFVIYRSPIEESIDMENSKYILDIVNGDVNSYVDTTNEYHYYMVTALDKLSNESIPTNTVSNLFADIKDTKPISDNFYLAQNYPNPFNPITTIQYSVPYLEYNSIIHLQIKVFDALGNDIITLVDEQKSAGNYFVKFDGSDLASGIYYYRMIANNFIKTNKMILIK